MNGLIEWLENLQEKDKGVRAVLRRSLAFPPGTYVSAFPYVEPFVKAEENWHRREAYYLAAGLWAAHKRDGHAGEGMTIGTACAAYRNAKKSESVERRFITLLDADADQLPNRLRQMTALLKDYRLDFEHLLKGLLDWNDDQKRTQNSWARDFYRGVEEETETTHPKEKMR